MKKCNAILLKETLKETNRLKSNFSAKSSIYALLMVHCPFLLSLWLCCAPNSCAESIPETTETNNAIMLHTESLTVMICSDLDTIFRLGGGSALFWCRGNQLP